MMNDSQSGEHSRVYVPLVQEGGRFIEASQDLSFEDYPIKAAMLDSSIKRDYEQIKATVEIGEEVYETRVFIPRKNAGFSYVLTDEDLVPVDVGPSQETELPRASEYFERIQSSLCRSEALTPEQETYLWTQFIRPNFLEIDQHGNKDRRSISWEQLLSFRHLVVLGAPGSGKTSCLRRIALEYANSLKTDKRRGTVPIYIQMRQFGEQEFDPESIQRLLANEDAGELANSFFSLSAAGKFLLILDGLDEVPDESRNKIVHSIKSMSEEFPRNRFVLSIRSTVYDWEFSNFKHLELQPFTTTQIEEWSCQKLFHTKKTPWKVFISHLKANNECLQLATNPLLLSLSVSQFLRHSVPPNNSAALYASFVDALTETWDSVRGVNRCNDRWAAPREKLYSLCKLAFYLSDQGKFRFSGQESTPWIMQTSERIPYQKALSALAGHTGLIREVSNDQWEFSHQVFLEYFTAQYLVNSTNDVNSLLSGRLSNKRWQDIWILACGVTQDATHLLQMVLGNSELGRLTKANLFTEAISQGVNTDQNTLKKCYDLILAVLEECMANVDVVDSYDPAVYELIDDTIQWSMALSTNDRAFSTRDGLHLRRLIHSLFKSKPELARRGLVDRLRNSQIRSVKYLSQSFESEGELQDRTLETDRGETLLLYVKRSSAAALNWTTHS